MQSLDIPVVIFMFKRGEKTATIVAQIAKVRPKKVYLIGDGPRNSDEVKAVNDCRELVEKHITWDCEVIKNYADANRGVYHNIAGGAKWVFERESKAIFLEDDNFPDLSFFQYCQDLLEKYEEDNRVLWICGTNYMQKYQPEDGSDYVFTKHMLPCGWASWANKFNKFYDGMLSLYLDSVIQQRVRHCYDNQSLYAHDKSNWDRMWREISNGKSPLTWDYQMAFSIRINNLYGIAPKYNLIKNIGADVDSIHGGTSMEKVMTSRFCEVPTYSMEFPLKHPKALMVDSGFERLTTQIILPPLSIRVKGKVVALAKRILGIKPEESLSKKIKFWK